MNNTQLVSLLAGVGLLLAQTPALAGMAWAPAVNSQYAKDQILVKFKPSVAAAMRTQMAQTYGAQAMQALGNQPDLVVANLTPGQNVEQAIATFASDPNVAYAQPNYVYHTQAVPTDPQYGQLWAVKNTGQTIATPSYATNNPGTAGDDMNLESAWNIQTDCSSVVVAVVDTGINYNSTDLAANMWMGNAKHGQNFAPDVATGVGSDPMDLAGHGTHVAGIIGAAANNGIAGVGVCWNAKLMAVRVLDATGYGTTASIIAGISYAVSNGAKVINMSLGGTGGFDQAYSDAITNAQNNNVLVVVAAANDSQNNDITPHWPCNFTHSNLICVAALDQSYALASFSDYGATSVDVGAPGTNIYSTWAGTSATLSDPLTAGWTLSGGWGYGSWFDGVATHAGLADPATWSTGTYLANANDHAYKNFNLSAYNAAVMNFYLSGVVNTGDSLTLALAPTGGDPFTAGGAVAAGNTPLVGGAFNFYPSFRRFSFSIPQCLTTTCTIGAALTSAAASTGAKGPMITMLTIDTLVLNNASYNTIDGTSMATPEVAGVAALVWAHNPQYTYADVANAIKNGGRSVAALSGKTTTGKAVDALGALTYINQPTGVAVVVH